MNLPKASVRKNKRAEAGIFIVFTLISALVVSPVWAAWGEKSLPVPPGVEKLKSETRNLGGIEFKFSYYSSSSSIKNIKDFYRTRLVSDGWQELALQKSVSYLPQADQKVSESLEKFSQVYLAFLKEGRTITITFIPEGVATDGKTRFSVTEQVAPFRGMTSGDIARSGAVLEKPSKNFAPEYPGADRMGVHEQKGRINVAYVVEDDPGKILSFYKNKMAGYGWTLKDDIPLQETSTRELMEKFAAEGCAECAKAESYNEGTFGLLNFYNTKGDNCKVGVFKSSRDQGDALLAKLTHITVSYEEKK